MQDSKLWSLSSEASFEGGDREGTFALKQVFSFNWSHFYLLVCPKEKAVTLLTFVFHFHLLLHPQHVNNYFLSTCNKDNFFIIGS